MDPNRKSLPLFFVLIEKRIKTLHMVLFKRPFDHLRGFRVFLLPIQLVPALDVFIRMKQNITVPVIQIRISRRTVRGVNRLDGHGPKPGVPAQFGIIIEFFAFQDIGQFPGHVFGLVLDDVLAHQGEDAIRMEHMVRRDVAHGLVGDFDGALGDLAQHVRVDEPGAGR